MRWRNWLNAVIGLWFVISPWVLGYANEVDARSSAVIAGAIQVVVSAWAGLEADTVGWRIWQNWASFACGLWFLMHPFLTHLEVGEFWTIAAPAIITMALNLWTLMLNPESAEHSERTT